MRHMSVKNVVLCEMHFSALFEQIRQVMVGLILMTNTATESMTDISAGVDVKSGRTGPADKIHSSLKSGWFLET